MHRKPIHDLRAQAVSEMHPRTHDCFVLELQNNSKAITFARQDYYLTTRLAEETDPNEPHALKEALEDIAPKVAADTAYKNAKENTPHRTDRARPSARQGDAELPQRGHTVLQAVGRKRVATALRRRHGVRARVPDAKQATKAKPVPGNGFSSQAPVHDFNSQGSNPFDRRSSPMLS